MLHRKKRIFITMKNKNTTQKYVAKTLFGLEKVLSEELTQLGAKNISIAKRAVYFEGDEELFYTANLSLRTCLRILKPIKRFKAADANVLYDNVLKYNWHKIISSKDTFSIDSVVNSEYFKHSKYAALKVKDAIVDQIRNVEGKRPSVDVENPTYRINVHIEKNNCTISLDSSGESLHKRGYRLSGETAPLNEVLAAGMIKLSGWDGNSNFIDPMCGSGTLVIEAALLAQNIAPNLNRKYFGFMNWESFDENLFKKVKQKLFSEQKEFNSKIIGNDVSKFAIQAAKVNAERAGVINSISFFNKNFANLQHNLESGIVITNPPYGERLKHDDIIQFYKKIGDTLKQNFTGFDVWILSANKEALKQIGLRTSRKLMLYNGALECKFHNYKMYKGSKKAKYK